MFTVNRDELKQMFLVLSKVCEKRVQEDNFILFYYLKIQVEFALLLKGAFSLAYS